MRSVGALQLHAHFECSELMKKQQHVLQIKRAVEQAKEEKLTEFADQIKKAEADAAAMKEKHQK